MTTKIYAHRGASKYAPENTMPAFQLALEMKADGIETDVQLTKDGVPILIHDEKLKRTTNGTGLVQDYTLEELKELDAGSWFSKSYQGTKLVTLEELLQWIKPTSLFLNIELKNNIIDYENLEKIVYNLVVTYGMLGRTVFSSFNKNSIRRLHKLDKNVNACFLTSRKIRRLKHFLRSIGATGVHAKYRLINTDFVSECKRHGFDLRVYTVNKPFSIVRCYQLGCTAIFTDVPDVAYDLYEKLPLETKYKRKNPFRRR
ncbi:glycerophosphodiester phosphodiesterase [Salirhabdus sp. Marseille-P4669]|uniref:glycerophosphodiester phosphodiesterase n=1 Tax=Salirhabdus sp. Marseille-P4669 TaxID=2042310 RepID=UPI000C7CB3C4|nr:glycerophosphodiester phosphodiesterase [Salirhabdus sp. Marseille-P4669]